MSRQIDLTKPLSDEDRAYLAARARHRDIAKADGNTVSSLPDDSLIASGERSPSAQPANVGAQNPSAQPMPGSQDLASPATSHQVGDEGHEDNYDDEDAWSYKDLQEEVSGREAEDAPALNSKREDLVAWLRQNDASGEGETN